MRRDTDRQKRTTCITFFQRRVQKKRLLFFLLEKNVFLKIFYVVKTDLFLLDVIIVYIFLFEKILSKTTKQQNKEKWRQINQYVCVLFVVVVVVTNRV